eukprot:m.63184 g.63184  ORF g.63184 m.63184 type:complete len:325 (-) comp13833_c0_seq1:1375-2349(-)
MDSDSASEQGARESSDSEVDEFDNMTVEDHQREMDLLRMEFDRLKKRQHLENMQQMDKEIVDIRAGTDTMFLQRLAKIDQEEQSLSNVAQLRCDLELQGLAEVLKGNHSASADTFKYVKNQLMERLREKLSERIAMFVQQRRWIEQDLPIPAERPPSPQRYDDGDVAMQTETVTEERSRDKKRSARRSMIEAVDEASKMGAAGSALDGGALFGLGKGGVGGAARNRNGDALGAGANGHYGSVSAAAAGIVANMGGPGKAGFLGNGMHTNVQPFNIRTAPHARHPFIVYMLTDAEIAADLSGQLDAATIQDIRKKKKKPRRPAIM